jgi:hypothetical protein
MREILLAAVAFVAVSRSICCYPYGYPGPILLNMGFEIEAITN